jgi:hypothetical protein
MCGDSIAGSANGQETSAATRRHLHDLQFFVKRTQFATLCMPPQLVFAPHPRVFDRFTENKSLTRNRPLGHPRVTDQQRVAEPSCMCIPVPFEYVCLPIWAEVLQTWQHAAKAAAIYTIFVRPCQGPVKARRLPGSGGLPHLCALLSKASYNWTAIQLWRKNLPLLKSFVSKCLSSRKDPQ